MWQRASNGGGATVASGSMPIAKNTDPQTIDVGFEPDIFLMKSTGATGYHTVNYYIKDDDYNTANEIIRGFFLNNMSSGVNIKVIDQKTNQQYANYPWIYEINGSVVTWKTNASCTDTTMEWTAIKL